MAAGRAKGKSALAIRAYRDGDRDAVVALWEACGLRAAWNDPDDDLALFQKTASAEIFVGEAGGRMVASLCAGHDGHRGWIYYMGVAPDVRGKGFGGALLRHAEAWFAEGGIAKVQLLVREHNLGVKAFYASLGYQPNACHIMQRWLDGRDAPRIDTGRDDGKLEMTVTFLEMTERPTHPHVPPPLRMKVSLLRAVRPTVAFYRFLYNTVGTPWLWYERRAMDDAALAPIIQDERVEIYVLYVDGVPAGFAELDRRRPPDIDLAYFGLMPAFIGQGLGRYLLTWAIDTAWSHEPERLLVTTSTLDHAKALPLYQRCGFRPYKQERRVSADPRLTGLIPMEEPGR